MGLWSESLSARVCCALMADPAHFGHDMLGHLLADRLLKVPLFQRRYSWHEEQVSEYWSDIQRARGANSDYFMGTVVLAADVESEHRELIIDGQQRITTTALLLIAIRDRLKELDHAKAAGSVEQDYLSNYVLEAEQDVAKLTLSSTDHDAYNSLIAGSELGGKSALAESFAFLKARVTELVADKSEYKQLIALVSYLKTRVQVLLAIASGLQEAYVIFETLNDRGADLTTADLLKNYLFSQAGDDGIVYAEAVWTRISARLEKPDDLVKFLRYEYMSRKGRVTNRGLYKALQGHIGDGGISVSDYLTGLEKALSRFVALREPDDASWSSQAVEVKDSLLAFRRFGFESSMPLLLAAFASWSHTEATKFVDVVAAWSVRAWTAGTLGGGQAEAAFCDAAVAVTTNEATNVEAVKAYVADIVPDDPTFRRDFIAYGSITTTRAKYLLARLERQRVVDQGQTTDGMPDWSSKSVSVEHIFPKSSKSDVFANKEDYDTFLGLRDKLQNLTLLERSLNGGLDDKQFSDKAQTYKDSVFGLTQELGSSPKWDFEEANSRAEKLADLAVKAWPL